MATQYTIDECTLYIDAEFSGLLPSEPVEKLREQVEADGVFLTEIVAWECENDKDGNRSGTIIDGHRRYHVWQSLPDDTPVPPPRMRFKKFANRSEAMLWSFANQDSRRNMTRQQLAAVRKRLYDAVKADTKDNLIPGGSSKGQNDPSRKSPKKRDSAAKAVAEKTGGSEATVKRDSRWVDAVQKIAQANGKAGADLRKGVLKPPMIDVITVAKLGPVKISAALKNWRNDRKWDDDGDGAAAGQGDGKGADAKPRRAAAAIVLDAIERPVPNPLAAAHGLSAELQAIGRRLDAIKREALAAAEQPGGYFLDTTALEQAARAMKNAITQSRYWSACPRCEGEGKKCPRCDGQGWLPFSRKGRLSDEDKGKLGL